MGNVVSWTNLNADGRRLERIIKLCETMISKALNEEPPNYDLVLAFIDRFNKTESQKVKVVDLVLGISHLRKIAEGKLEQPRLKVI